jgi:hypothetical protein
MKPQGSHAHEDRLLDFAYGELPPSEAQVMEQHVQGCSRCTEALDDIRGVRVTMSRLPLHSAPDSGMESLMAYAQQAARRSAAGPAPAARWWRRLLAPALGMAAVSVFGVVVLQVNREVDLSPALSKKESSRERIARQEPTSAKDLSAQPVSAAAPSPAAPSPAAQQMHEELDERFRAAEQRPAPAKPQPKELRREEYADWSNAGAGSAGGFPEKRSITQSVKTKRGTSSSGRTSLSVATSQPTAEPAPVEAPADAEESLAAGAAPVPGESQMAQYAPPSSPAQRIIGSTSSRAAPKKSVASYDDDAQPAPGRAEQPTAAPPPPPPLAQSQAPATAGASVRPEGLADKKEDAAQKVQEKSAGPKGMPSPTDLLRQADVANRSGDREQESMLLRAALSAGARGAQRVEALSGLCEAEFALGRERNALEFCKRVMAEAPGSSEARAAQRLLERELQAPARK